MAHYIGDVSQYGQASRMRPTTATTSGLSPPARLVFERGYEGLVGKDEASPYREGGTLSWLKVKQPRYREGERGWGPKGKCYMVATRSLLFRPACVRHVTSSEVRE
jgi:hypothetical protein